jgi:hypothetical protein
MRGDADAVMRLWRQMTGQEQEESLEHVWAVRLGQVTEQLQLDWLEEKNRIPVTRRGEVVVHSMHDFFACTLDGYLEDPGLPVEVKHVGGREPIEVVIERYQPQVHWQMCCMNSTQCVLSIIQGANEPVVEYIPMDWDYAGELMRRGLQFMEFVRKGVPPVILPPVPAPPEKWVDYNMAGNDVWRRFAEQWLQTKGAADSCKEAEKTLKSLCPEDARKCFADGVRITRSRAGALSLRVDS